MHTCNPSSKVGETGPGAWWPSWPVNQQPPVSVRNFVSNITLEDLNVDFGLHSHLHTQEHVPIHAHPQDTGF